jgi:hypothetical protein
MRTSHLLPFFLAPLAIATWACSPPTRNTPIAEIPKLKSLSEVMDNQATVADPEMSKTGQSSYTDADWTAFTNAATRLQATAPAIKNFSKGPEFDGLADKLGQKAKDLGDAAGAKDVAKASTALAEMKATCKECHSKFR